ncbi:spore germination protein [Geomicrobium sp. JCM 19038]|uniref:spore germination protein n=1 Tax=Geomicrobium sp. JCM 19038 TaxID=1460635 RepID=UPI00045F4461|nr:spore germination protein [Geomicrobium sp. JCM 19038]GAK09078.1 spore germination protein GerKA [Geomicrobium sp. JCM 19038]
MSVRLRRRYKQNKHLATHVHDHISPHAVNNFHQIMKRTGESDDILHRSFTFPTNKTKASLIYVDGTVDSQAIEKILSRAKFYSDNKDENYLSYFNEVGTTKIHSSIPSILNELLSGHVIIFIDGQTDAYSVSLIKIPERSITEPLTETVIRGPREGFIESLRVNTSLVRRRLPDEKLRFEPRTIGSRTKTKINIAYIEGVADESLLTELRQRLDRIETDSILEDGNIEELIQDATYTPFPTVYSSERPDTVTSHLLEGKTAIFVDGSPFVLIVPALFVQFFHNAEDHTQRADIASLVRLLRFGAAFIALLAPSLYIAITTFHQELIPTRLLGNLAAQSEGTPFPTFIEAVLMEITFEILREAGIRMPQPVGQAVSIVGAIVIGQAAVQAGIFSAAVVIVVSLTAIASFVFPSYSMASPFRILRFGFMGLAASFGLLGISVGFTAMLLHLSSLKSFGIPYMSDLSPFVYSDQKDALIRLPKWMMKERPKTTDHQDVERQHTRKPSPDQ